MSPMLYYSFTHDCLSCHVRTKILIFADEITVIGLITNSDELSSGHQQHSLEQTRSNLPAWAMNNSLSLKCFFSFSLSFHEG